MGVGLKMRLNWLISQQSWLWLSCSGLNPDNHLTKAVTRRLTTLTSQQKVSEKRTLRATTSHPASGGRIAPECRAHRACAMGLVLVRGIGRSLLLVVAVGVGEGEGLARGRHDAVGHRDSPVLVQPRTGLVPVRDLHEVGEVVRGRGVAGLAPAVLGTDLRVRPGAVELVGSVAEAGDAVPHHVAVRVHGLGEREEVRRPPVLRVRVLLGAVPAHRHRDAGRRPVGEGRAEEGDERGAEVGLAEGVGLVAGVGDAVAVEVVVDGGLHHLAAGDVAVGTVEVVAAGDEGGHKGHEGQGAKIQDTPHREFWEDQLVGNPTTAEAIIETTQAVAEVKGCFTTCTDRIEH